MQLDDYTLNELSNSPVIRKGDVVSDFFSYRVEIREVTIEGSNGNTYVDPWIVIVRVSADGSEKVVHGVRCSERGDWVQKNFDRYERIAKSCSQGFNTSYGG